MKTIYCFGNPKLPTDSLALELAQELEIPGVEFIACLSPEELCEHNAKELWIMDVARGINKVTLLSDISKLKTAKLVSLHDFDLAYFLKLMEKMGELPEVKIIALPMKGEKKTIKQEVEKLLKIHDNQND